MSPVCDELLVVGDGANLETGVVFINECRLERVDRHFKDVEVTRVALVRRIEERFLVKSCKSCLKNVVNTHAGKSLCRT